jgi:parallel beta-helix repeat protein
LLTEQSKENFLSYTVEDNTVNELPLGYFENKTDNTITEKYGQLILINCNNTVVKNQNCSNTSIGIALYYCYENQLENNTCNNNSFHGIYLWYSNSSIVTHNICNSNSGTGIYLYFSGSSTVKNNICKNNEQNDIFWDPDRDPTIGEEILNIIWFLSRIVIYLFFIGLLLFLLFLFIRRRSKEVINLPIKTDLTNDTINLKNALISIIGAVIFTVFTVLLPFFKVLGGFLTYSYGTGIFGLREQVFYWDQVASISTRVRGIFNYSYNYLEFSKDQPTTALIWQIIYFWGPIWVILGLIGAVLMVLPVFQKKLKQKPVNVAKIGLILGLVATGVEFGLFFLAWVFSNNTRRYALDNARNLHINFFLLDCFVIGWLGLIVGYMFSHGRNIK